MADHINDKMVQVSVKGMFFDPEGRVMLMQEKNGTWELPGGRLQMGENIIDCLTRECKEETGLDCEVLHPAAPTFAWSAIDKEGRGRVMLCYSINLPHTEIHPSDECVAVQFYHPDEIDQLQLYPQMKRFAGFLREREGR